MRRTISVVPGLICHQCLGRAAREGFAATDRTDSVHYTPVDAEERQGVHLRRLFDTETPTICERCLEGRIGDADGWLEERIDSHCDDRAEVRGAVERVIGLIQNYRDDALDADASEHHPEVRLDPLDGYEAGDPDVRVELAYLEIVPIWLDLELLRIAPTVSWGSPPAVREGELERQRSLWADYRAALARFGRVWRETSGRREDPPGWR